MIAVVSKVACPCHSKRTQKQERKEERKKRKGCIIIVRKGKKKVNVENVSKEKK